MRLAERALEGGTAAAPNSRDWIGFYSAAAALGYAGELERADQILTEGLEEARRRGSLLGVARALGFRAFANYRLGRARKRSPTRRRLWRMTRAPAWAGPLTNAVLADALMERCDLAAAERALDLPGVDAWSGSAPYAYYLVARGRLRLLRGAADTALADFLECGELLAGLHAPEPGRDRLALLGRRSRYARRGLGPRAAGRGGAGGSRAARAPQPVGIALRVRGLMLKGVAGIDSLREAVDVVCSQARRRARGRRSTSVGPYGATASASAPPRSSSTVSTWQFAVVARRSPSSHGKSCRWPVPSRGGSGSPGSSR